MKLPASTPYLPHRRTAILLCLGLPLLGCETEQNDLTEQVQTLQHQFTAQSEQIQALETTNLSLQSENEALNQRISGIESQLELDVQTRITSLENQLELQEDNTDLVMTELTDQAYSISGLDERLQSIEDDYLSSSNLMGLASETWIQSQGYSSESWVLSQNYGNAADVAANMSNIAQNTNYIAGNSSSINNINTRLLTVENTYLQQSDLNGYATQLWVNGQAYALHSDLISNATNIALNAQDITQNEASLLAQDVRLGVIESDYVLQSHIADQATQTWVLGQEYVNQSDINVFAGQQQQNTTDILALQSSVNTIELDYVTGTMLNGYALETWVLSTAALGSVVENLSDYLTIDTNTHSLTFTGANLYVQSGSGSSDDGIDAGSTLLGLGNLIVGYNDTDGTLNRSGSHNLVLGDQHSYSSYGGFVAGYGNSISNKNSSILGGRLNESTGEYSSICGGYEGTSSGNYSSILGGYQNISSNSFATIAGGGNNESSGPKSSVSGGSDNLASGAASSISGGDGNESSGLSTSISGGSFNETVGSFSNISGGYNNTSIGFYSSVLGGADNQTIGTSSSVTGGYLNTVDGQRASITGGYNNTTTADYAAICGGYLNVAEGAVATVSGGSENSAFGEYSSINGGYSNDAVGNYSSILGGFSQTANGTYTTNP